MKIRNKLASCAISLWSLGLRHDAPIALTKEKSARAIRAASLRVEQAFAELHALIQRECDRAATEKERGPA